MTFKTMTKKLLPLLALLIAGAAGQAGEVRSITVTLTNLPALTDSMTWRSTTTRTFAAARSSTTFLHDGASIAANATNLFNQVTIYPLPAPTPDLYWSSPTSFTFRFKPSEGTGVGISVTPPIVLGWAQLTTNDITTGGGSAVRMPITIEKNLQRTNIASGLVESFAYASNSVLASWQAFTNLVGSTGDQVISGLKTFESGAVLSNAANHIDGGLLTDVLVSNAVFQGTLANMTNGYWTNGITQDQTASNLTAYLFDSPGAGTLSFQAGPSGATANGDWDLQIGSGNQTTGDYRIGIGFDFQGGPGEKEIAIGHQIEAGFTYGLFIGNNIAVNASNSIALGHGANINLGATNSAAIGHGATVTTPHTIELGTTSEHVHALGWAEFEGGISNLTTLGNFQVDEEMHWPSGVYTTLGDSNNIINPAGESFIRLTGAPTADWNLAGIQDASVNGRTLLALNHTGYIMNVLNNSGLEPNDEQRIITPTQGDYEVEDGAFAWFYWDATGDRWRMIGLGAGDEAAAAVTNGVAALFFHDTGTYTTNLTATDVAVTNFTTGFHDGLTGFTYNGTITNQTAGYYQIGFAASFSGANADEIHFHVVTNGVESAIASKEFLDGSTQKGTSGEGILYLPELTGVQLFMAADDGASTLTMYQTSLNIHGNIQAFAGDGGTTIATNGVVIGNQPTMNFIEGTGVVLLATNTSGQVDFQFNSIDVAQSTNINISGEMYATNANANPLATVNVWYGLTNTWDHTGPVYNITYDQTKGIMTNTVGGPVSIDFDLSVVGDATATFEIGILTNGVIDWTSVQTYIQNFSPDGVEVSGGYRNHLNELGTTYQLVGRCTSQSSATLTVNAGSWMLESQIWSTLGSAGGDTNTVQAATGTTYTLVDADLGKVLTFTNAADILITVPTGLAVGFNCDLVALSSSTMTITNAASLDLRSFGDLRDMNGKNATASLISTEPDTFILTGNLK